jgi:CBS domain-containing protein
VAHLTDPTPPSTLESAELETAGARSALGRLTAADAMVRRPVTVDAHTSVQDFMDDAFFPTRHTAFPVVDDGRVAGLVSFRQALAVPRELWSTVAVREIMLPAEAVCLDPGTPLSDALARLTTSPLRRLLVCRGGELAGLLSLTDVGRLVEARGGASPPVWVKHDDRDAVLLGRS